jgi:hypothetical protein
LHMQLLWYQRGCHSIEPSHQQVCTWNLCGTEVAVTLSYHPQSFEYWIHYYNFTHEFLTFQEEKVSTVSVVPKGAIPLIHHHWEFWMLDSQL